jgi:hypothetical protein
MLQQELSELEVRMGLRRGQLQLIKYPGRGGWTVAKDRVSMTPVPLEARYMLSTIQFANWMLQSRKVK